MRVIPQENGGAWIQCGDIPICHCESIEKAEIVMDMLVEGINAREELATLKGTFVPNDLDRTLELFEIHLISKALGNCNYNNSYAAKALGIGRTSLIERRKRYGICETDGSCSETNCAGAAPARDVSSGSSRSGKGGAGPSSSVSGEDALCGGEDTWGLSYAAAKNVSDHVDRK